MTDTNEALAAWSVENQKKVEGDLKRLYGDKDKE